MTRSAASVPTVPGFSALVWFARSLALLVKAFKDRREVMDLAEFDEHMLRDIGLTRSDVASALAEPVHHHPSWVLVRRVADPAPASGPAASRNLRPVVPVVSRAGMSGQ